MNAYNTIAQLPNGKVSTAYVITARTIDEAARAAHALSVIHGIPVILAQAKAA